MTLLTFLSFLKKNWIIGVLIGAAIYHYTRMSNMGELLDIANESSRFQITRLQELHVEELKQRDELQEEYEEKVEKIEKKYKMAKWALRKERKGRIDAIKRIPKEKLIQLVKDTFGLEYVEK